jgi:putative transposase
MRTLQIDRTDVTRKNLLALADRSPGAWLGLRIAAMLLFLDGYRPTFLAELLGVSRMTLTRWVHRLNGQGPKGLLEKARPGRPTQLTPRLRRQLSARLKQSPERYGLPRVVWDGPTLVEHLRQAFGIHLKVRQAQQWLHRLGYGLKRATYVYLQAKAEDVQKFRRRVKKTPLAGKERGADL